MLYLVLTLNIFNFFIANFEHVFISWAQDKIHKTTYVHIKHWRSFFKIHKTTYVHIKQWRSFFKIHKNNFRAH